MDTNKIYTSELKNETSYTATWLPSTIVNLGDIGVLDNYTYTYRNTLENLGVAFNTRTKANKTNFSYTSAGSVKIDFKLDGELPSPGVLLKESDAGMSIKFEKERAIFFYAADCVHYQIADLQQLEKDIIDLKAAGKWSSNMVVITEVFVAEKLTILISKSAGANAEFKFTVPTQTPSINLLNGNASLLTKSNLSTEIISQGNLTPLFRCIGLHKKLFGPQVIVDRGFEKSSDFTQEMDYSDYES
jgi:hypothetical protein